ncbi:MAG: putative aminohydrolase SsnA [Candidatus Eisenbacteria bacterium]|jgi:cytosine/adenosine deaminase-related metal-dependent hydrolase
MIVGPCTVITGGPEPKVYEDAGVRIVGSHIAQIAGAGDLARAYPDETLWPARDRVVMPGFVNTHAHLARHLARGLGLREPAEWRAYDRALSAEDVKQAVSAALVEGLRHGVTTVVDFHRSGACLDLSLSEVMGAADAVGVRVATCYGAAEEDTPLERRAAIDESVGFAKELSRRRQGRLRGMLGVQARTLGGIETLLAEAMEAAGSDYAVHVDLALDLTPAERWGRPHVLPSDALPALWAHAERAPRDLLGAVRDRGDALSASGVHATAAQLRDSELAWGSDEGVNAPPVPEGAFAPRTSEAHYRRLFVHGARWAADHFGEELGVLAPGAPADLIMLDYRPATELSNRTVQHHLWTGLLRSGVSGVMVAGRVVMDNGVLTTVDEREVSIRARECAARLWRRLG